MRAGLVIEASSFQFMYWEAFGRQIQDVLNHCHNPIQEPMDLSEAQGFAASAVRMAMWSAWSAARDRGRPFSPGGREGWIPGSGLRSRP